MEFAAVIIDDGGWWLCKSSKEDVEWMFRQFMTLHDFKPTANSVLAVSGKNSR